MDPERKFQSNLKKELYETFPGCIVLKNDPNDIQGIPDLSIFWKNHWAFLECKKSKNEVHQPNQDDYIQYANESSYGAFIYPENKEEILNELKSAFGLGG